jgi:hypothetical protein
VPGWVDLISPAAHGALVEVAARVLEDQAGNFSGTHTPAGYLAWRAGISPARAGELVRLARRRHELPACIEALGAGELSIDPAVELARHVPAAYDRAATDQAREMTVRQLRSVLPAYGYEDPERPKPAPQDAERSVSSGTDGTGWWLRARLPADEGAVVQAAIVAMRDDLYRRQKQVLPEGETPRVTAADGLLCAAEAALRSGEAAHPGSDRYQVHLHLEQGPGADTSLSTHLGQRLPQWLHELLLCDCALRATTYRHGVPVAAGRKTRVISRRLRRIIEHRDGGCRVPGCTATLGLEIHHIVHWEHLGPTDPGNLVTLCRRHHRDHHQGRLGITGDADLPRSAVGAVRFTDRWDHTLDPVGTGQTLPTRAGLIQRARDAAVEPVRYRSPRGGPLARRDFTLEPPVASSPPPTDVADHGGGAPRAAWDRPDDDAVPDAAGAIRHPTRAGPGVAA